MKKLIQLFLFILIVFISFFVYKKYFPTNLKNNDITSTDEKVLSENQKNLIKNLKYNVKFDDDSEYNIIADTSELTYENNVEIVKMDMVRANLIDKNRMSLVIKSNKAKYNNNNYNTNFWDKVTIEYDNNVIIANNLDLNFDKNIIKIYNNVVYKGLEGIIKTDNVKIDLSTKNAKIFMDNSKNNVTIETN